MKNVMQRINSCSECKLCDDDEMGGDVYCDHMDFPRKEDGKFSEICVDHWEEVDPRCPYAKEDYNK